MLPIHTAAILPEEAEEFKNWLKNSRGPFSKVCDYMQKTLHIRKQEILSSNFNSILDEWPRLFDTEGAVSWEMDIYLNLNLNHFYIKPI